MTTTDLVAEAIRLREEVKQLRLQVAVADHRDDRAQARMYELVDTAVQYLDEVEYLFGGH